jgi:hypothetical protein
MINENILIAACDLLRENSILRTLPSEAIYPTPVLGPYPSMSPIEIQVADGGDRIDDQDGNVLRSTFELTAGIYYLGAKDHSGRHSKTLTEIAANVYRYRDAVIDALFRSYLPDKDETDLLVRPLILLGDSGNRSFRSYPHLVYREVHFAGGMNASIS